MARSSAAGTKADRMSASETSRAVGPPDVEQRGRQPRRQVEPAQVVHPAGPEAGLLRPLRAGELLRGPVLAGGPGALRELPAAAADGVAELLDQPEAVP